MPENTEVLGEKPEEGDIDGKEGGVKQVEGASRADEEDEELGGVWALLHPQPSPVRLARVEGAGRGLLATRWGQTYRNIIHKTMIEVIF